jgi:hypothetical protein
MLPLGLIIIAQDLRFLQAPLVRTFQWIEASWDHWQQWRKLHSPSRKGAKTSNVSRNTDETELKSRTEGKTGTISFGPRCFVELGTK